MDGATIFVLVLAACFVGFIAYIAMTSSSRRLNKEQAESRTDRTSTNRRRAA